MLHARPAYYRTVDPVGNLALHVSITKLRDSAMGPGGGKENARQKNKNKKKKKKKNKNKKRGDDDDEEDEDDDSEDDEDSEEEEAGSPSAGEVNKTWQATVTWQEKKFSPHEILTYGPANDDGKRGKKKNATVVERGYQQELRKMFENSKDATPEKTSVHISTYIDKDGFVPTQELANKTTSHRTDIPELGRAVALLPVRGGQHSSRGSATRIRRETKCKTMHIMATIDAKEAMEKDPTAPRFFEVVLCSIKYYEDGGLLEMKPPIDGRSSADSGAAQNALSSNLRGQPSILEKGVGTYRFQSPLGAQYEYTIRNVAEVTDAIIAEELREAAAKRMRAELERLRNKVVPSLTREEKDEYTLRMYAFCEIVSASRFDGRSLYVQWQVQLPATGWSYPKEWSDEEIQRRTSGSTQISRATFNRTSHATGAGSALAFPVASFAFPIELEFVSVIESNAALAHEWPKLFIEVGSAGTWGRHYVEGYGYTSLPRTPGAHTISIRTWKPRGSITDQMANFFLGGAHHLTDHTEYVATSRGAEKQQVGSGSTFLNKYGFSTESSGDVEVRVNMCIQRQEDDEEEEDDAAAAQQAAAAAPTTKRDFNDILKSYNLEKRTNLADVLGKARSSGTGLQGLYSSLRSASGRGTPARTPLNRSRARMRASGER